jgi:hypothetical protein
MGGELRQDLLLFGSDLARGWGMLWSEEARNVETSEGRDEFGRRAALLVDAAAAATKRSDRRA